MPLSGYKPTEGTCQIVDPYRCVLTNRIQLATFRQSFDHAPSVSPLRSAFILVVEASSQGIMVHQSSIVRASVLTELIACTAKVLLRTI